MRSTEGDLLTGKKIKVYYPDENKGALDYIIANIDAASFSDLIGLYGGLQEAEEDPSAPGCLKVSNISYDSVKNKGVYVTRSLSLVMRIERLQGGVEERNPSRPEVAHGGATCFFRSEAEWILGNWD